MHCGSIRIIGVGNPLFGEEGVGYRIAKALLSCGMPPSIVDALEVLDVSAIYPLSENADCVIVLDAIMHGEAKDVRVLELRGEALEEALEELKVGLITIDPHVLSPIQLFLLAYAVGVFKGKAFIILIPTESFEESELSERTLGHTIKALEILKGLLSRLGMGETANSIDEECYRKEVGGSAAYPTT